MSDASKARVGDNNTAAREQGECKRGGKKAQGSSYTTPHVTEQTSPGRKATGHDKNDRRVDSCGFEMTKSTRQSATRPKSGPFARAGITPYMLHPLMPATPAASAHAAAGELEKVT